jgi:hypothetical protein
VRGDHDALSRHVVAQAVVGAFERPIRHQPSLRQGKRLCAQRSS